MVHRHPVGFFCLMLYQSTTRVPGVDPRDAEHQWFLTPGDTFTNFSLTIIAPLLILLDENSP